MVINPPAHTGDTGSNPGLGTEIPQASGRLSPCTTTNEPMGSGARAPQQEKPLQ